jgi:hypothetical protein
MSLFIAADADGDGYLNKEEVLLISLTTGGSMVVSWSNPRPR